MNTSTSASLFVVCGLTAGLLASLSVAAQAQIKITTNDGQGGDAQIRGGNRDGNNYGVSGSIALKWQDNSYSNNRKGYFRYDLNSKGVAPASITDATVQFTVQQGDNVSDPVDWNFDVYGLNDGALDSWKEGIHDNSAVDPTEINWKNAPGNINGGSVPPAIAGKYNDLDPALVTNVGSFIINGVGTTGTVVTITGPTLVNFLKADTNGLVTFIVLRREKEPDADNSVVHRLFTREGAIDANKPEYAPTLFITAVPEPNAVIFGIFAGGSLLGLVARKRKE